MSKGEEKQQMESKVIRGRVLPSMPKGEIVGILSLMAKDMAKKRDQRRSRVLVNNNTHSRRMGKM